MVKLAVELNASLEQNWGFDFRLGKVHIFQKGFELAHTAAAVLACWAIYFIIVAKQPEEHLLYKA